MTRESLEARRVFGILQEGAQLLIRECLSPSLLFSTRWEEQLDGAARHDPAVNPEAEQLGENGRRPVRNDRRTAISNFIEELDHLGRFDGAAIPMRLLREGPRHIRDIYGAA